MVFRWPHHGIHCTKYILVTICCILTYPCISAETVAPDLSIIASTSSITSKYASLLVYFTPERRQGTLDSWPVGSVALTLYKR